MGELLLEYRAHIETLQADGADLVQYQCPSCRVQLITRVPLPGWTFDSLVICPYCEKQHFKVVRSDGRVTTEEV